MQIRRWLWLCGFLFAALSLLAGCGSSVRVTPGELIYDAEIIVYQGEDLFRGSEGLLSELFASGKPVVLVFWAGLCPVCHAELPNVQEMYERYRDQVVFFGVDVGPFTGLGFREDGKALLEELEITFAAGTTIDPEIVRAYEVFGVPTTLFVEPSGAVLVKWPGPMPRAKFIELADDLIEASAAQE